MMGRRPDSTLGKLKIVIGMRTTGMMNKQIARHLQACECTTNSLRTKICQKIENHAVKSRKTPRKENIENVTSFRRNRFLSRA